MATTKFRVYADGRVEDEEDFAELDNAVPYYDDYFGVSVPDEVIAHITHGG